MDIPNIAVNPVHFALLVPFLNGLGRAFKAIPQLNNQLIPFLLMVAGGVSFGFLSGWNAQNVMVGAIAGMAAVGGHQLVSSVSPKSIPPGTSIALLGLFLFVGCSTYTTTQRDISPERTIETRVSVSTFWDSKSQLANSKATQTDKSQSAFLGTLAQESSSTNLLSELEAVVQILKLVRPTP